MLLVDSHCDLVPIQSERKRRRGEDAVDCCFVTGHGGCNDDARLNTNPFGSSKKQRLGNFAKSNVESVVERVLLWLSANFNRSTNLVRSLPRTMNKLEKKKTISFISTFKSQVEPDTVFYYTSFSMVFFWFITRTSTSR